MTNTEIDRKLALAIGYAPEHIHCFPDGSIGVLRPRNTTLSEQILLPFDHQDAYVILPIMERYDCLPHKLWNDEWVSNFEDMPGVAAGVHTNPRTAAALAVIKAKEMGLI